MHQAILSAEVSAAKVSELIKDYPKHTKRVNDLYGWAVKTRLDCVSREVIETVSDCVNTLTTLYVTRNLAVGNLKVTNNTFVILGKLENYGMDSLLQELEDLSAIYSQKK